MRLRITPGDRPRVSLVAAHDKAGSGAVNISRAAQIETVDKRIAQPYFELPFALVQRLVQVPVGVSRFLNTRGRTGEAV